MAAGLGSGPCYGFYDLSKMKKQACVATVDFQFLIANPSQMLLLPCLKGECKPGISLVFPGTDSSKTAQCKDELADSGFLVMHKIRSLQHTTHSLATLKQSKKKKNKPFKSTSKTFTAHLQI